jgi:hypothetical protein
VSGRSEAHPVSYPIRTEGKSRPGRNADHSPLLVSRSNVAVVSPVRACRAVAGRLYCVCKDYVFEDRHILTVTPVAVGGVVVIVLAIGPKVRGFKTGQNL